TRPDPARRHRAARSERSPHRAVIPGRRHDGNGSMSGAVRIGVAGAGLIGRRHIELIAASPDCVLAGIADPSPEAKAFAEARQVPWYADHRALRGRERPGGMSGASPNALHLAMALDCIAQGVPALVEKPVTDKVASAQRLAEAVRRTGVPVLVG